MMRREYAAGTRRIDHLTTPIPSLGPILSMRVPVREETFNVHMLRTVLVLTRTVTVITSS